MFVYASGWAATPFTSTYERLKRDQGWMVKSLPTGHNVFGEAPGELLTFLQGMKSVMAEPAFRAEAETV